MFWRKHVPLSAADSLLDAVISVGQMPQTTLRELQYHAINIRNHVDSNSTERGLATTVTYLIERLEQEVRAHAGDH